MTDTFYDTEYGVQDVGDPFLVASRPGRDYEDEPWPPRLYEPRWYTFPRAATLAVALAAVGIFACHWCREHPLVHRPLSSSEQAWDSSSGGLPPGFQRYGSHPLGYETVPAEVPAQQVAASIARVPANRTSADNGSSGPGGAVAVQEGHGLNVTAHNMSAADGQATLVVDVADRQVAWNPSVAWNDSRACRNASCGETNSHANSSLFCFSLMMPHGYEVDLVKDLLARGVSIFACDDYSVFSSTNLKLSHSVVSEDIGSVDCGYGGPWHLALNSDIFVRVWTRVLKDRLWLRHGWTVKVDPDTVFLPSRLRDRVHGSDPEARVYLNNCDQGLHGPIEVLARGGMRAYRDGISDCVKALQKEFTWAGEDVFLRHCLGMLQVNRVDDFKLLSEQHCMWENPPVNGCLSGKVAFHPFKSSESYFRCLRQAHDHPPKESTDKRNETGGGHRPRGLDE